MTTTFELADIPATTRTSKPNMFDGKFPTPPGKALSETIPGVKGKPSPEVEARVKHITNQARRAAGALATPLTARVTNRTDDKGNVTVLIWTVDRITRKRKTGE